MLVWLVVLWVNIQKAATQQPRFRTRLGLMQLQLVCVCLWTLKIVNAPTCCRVLAVDPAACCRMFVCWGRPASSGGGRQQRMRSNHITAAAHILLLRNKRCGAADGNGCCGSGHPHPETAGLRGVCCVLWPMQIWGMRSSGSSKK